MLWDPVRSKSFIHMHTHLILLFYHTLAFHFGLPSWLKDGKESACNAGGPGSIPGLGRSPGEGNDNPLQYFCLENSMDRWACQATIHRARESDMTERLTHTHTQLPTSYRPSVQWPPVLIASENYLVFHQLVKRSSSGGYEMWIWLLLK